MGIQIFLMMVLLLSDKVALQIALAEAVFVLDIHADKSLEV